jgi:hypothetical protein
MSQPKPLAPFAWIRSASWWTRLWIASAIAIWAFDGWLIVAAVRELWTVEPLGRAEICAGDSFDDGSFQRTCMSETDVFERELAQRMALRQDSLSSARILAIAVMATITVAPFGIAAVFMAARRVVVQIRNLHRKSGRPKYMS